MEKTRIQPILKSKIIDYGNEEINNFWLRINQKTIAESTNNNLEKIISILDDVQDSVICIQTEKFEHTDIIKAIFNASKKRNRIYILTNEKDKSLKQLEGACLIRYGIKNIGSLILISPNTSSSKGNIYTAPFIETSLASSENITLKLDNEQIKTLFRFFSDNFWNKAEYEIINDFNNPKETTEPPLDFLPNIKDFCDADFAKNEISKIDNADIISVPSLQTNDLLSYNSLKNSEILTSLKTNDIELLQSIAHNNSIKAVELNTTRLIISENASWLIPKTNISENDNFFALKLNKTQTNKLEKITKNRFNKAEYEFYLSKTRKEVENKMIKLIDNIKNGILIKAETVEQLNAITLNEFLPKEEFEKQEPEFIDDGVSIEIKYNWEIIPFITPNNAKKAKLYEDWNRYQNEYKLFLEQIEKAIDESQNKSIGESLKRWFLGKKQTISKQQEQIDALKTKDLSILDKVERKKVINELNELAKKVFDNLSEINTKIKESEINNEIEQLNKQKEEKELELEIFIKKQEKELKEKEENKAERLQKFLEKHSKKENELATFKSDLQRKSGKKNKRKKPKEAEDAQKILDDLNSIQGFDFSKKFQDDKQNIEKELNNIDNKIKSKKKVLEKVGKEQQSNKSSSLNYAIGKGNNKNNTNQKREFNIDENIEYLPKIGELFEIRKQKYLDIEFWEDFQLAQEEIQRFNAKLSVKPL